MFERAVFYLSLCESLSIVMAHGFVGERPNLVETLQIFHQEKCLSLLASDEEIYQNFGASTLRSRNAKELLKLGRIDLLTDILVSTSCLITIVEADNLHEVFKIIDMVNEFPVSKKHLVVIVPKLDSNGIHRHLSIRESQNTTININVVVHQKHEVGKIFPQVCDNSCPQNAENIMGKVISVSFYGANPYIFFNPISGSDFNVAKLLAKKYELKMKFILIKPTTELVQRVSRRESEIGIGQHYFTFNRMKIVDYLHYMYCDQYILASRKPVPIPSYDTIVNPFDFFTWTCTFVTIISQFLLLLLLQNIWCHVSGKIKPVDYVYEDFFLSTELIPKRRLPKWFNREGFRTRKILILKWMVLGNILTMGYKSTLLSTLIPIRYESTIDTDIDLEESGLPLTIPLSTAIHAAIESDQRPIRKKIFTESHLYRYEGWNSTRELWKRAKNNTAVMLSIDTNRYRKMKEGMSNNDYHWSKEPFLSFFSSFTIPKGSPLKVAFEKDVMWLRDTGVLEKMKYDMIDTEMLDPLPKVWKNKSLSLLQLGIIMIITLIGMTLSIFVFMWEFLRRRQNGISQEPL